MFLLFQEICSGSMLVLGDVNFTAGLPNLIFYHSPCVHRPSFFITLHQLFIMFPASLVMFHRDFVIILRHVSSSIIIHQKILPAKQVAGSIQPSTFPTVAWTNIFSYPKKDHDYPSLPTQEPPCHNTDLGNVVQQIDLATDHNILEGQWPTVSTPSPSQAEVTYPTQGGSYQDVRDTLVITMVIVVVPQGSRFFHFQTAELHGLKKGR